MNEIRELDNEEENQETEIGILTKKLCWKYTWVYEVFSQKKKHFFETVFKSNFEENQRLANMLEKGSGSSVRILFYVFRCPYHF